MQQDRQARMPAVARTTRLRARGAGHPAPPRTTAALVTRPEEVPMLKVSRRIAFAALGSLLLLLPQALPEASATQQPTPFPLSITDDSGVTSTFAAPPQRV